MAPTPARHLFACLAAAAALVAGCTASPGPVTGVSRATAPPPTSSPSATTAGTVPAPPDLAGNVIDCTSVDVPCDHGDDPALDELWEACADGAGGACDRLYYDSAFDTRYEQFGNTCGDRDLTVPCPPRLDP